MKIFILILFWSGSVFSKAPDTLFEGYFKILNDGQAIGYQIARYNFDDKKKEFHLDLFTKLKTMKIDSTESLQAISKEDMTPVSYKYSMINNADIKTIDAKISKGKLTAVVSEGKKKKTIKLDLPKGTFLSYFLVYVMLKSPKGISEGTKYDYQAILEEDIKIEKGFALVKSIEKNSGLDTFKVLNEYGGKKFINYVTKTGQVISSKLPIEGLSVELVSQPSLATQSFSVPSSILKEIFGEVPTGITNNLSQLASQETPPPKIAEPVVPGKQEGVPQGMGIQLKGK